jgi:hypothetical protein
MKLTIGSARHSWKKNSSEKYNRYDSPRQSIREDFGCREVEFAESDSYLDIPPPGMHLLMARGAECDQVFF